jgi:hypothetical protein
MRVIPVKHRCEKSRIPATIRRGAASARSLEYRHNRGHVGPVFYPGCFKAPQQMKRVLKPGGRLIFLEHGLAPDRGVVALAGPAYPVWKGIAGGCHLNRKLDKMITGAGFQITDLKTFYLCL